MGLILNWQKHKLLTAALAVVVGVSLGAVLYGVSHLLRGHQAAQQTGSPAAGSGSQAERTIDEQVDQLIEIINGLESKDASDIAQLKQALSYNIVYFVKVNEDIAQAKEYANKLLEIDPENAMAKQVSELK